MLTQTVPAARYTLPSVNEAEGVSMIDRQISITLDLGECCVSASPDSLEKFSHRLDSH